MADLARDRLVSLMPELTNGIDSSCGRRLSTLARELRKRQAEARSRSGQVESDLL
jgi:hypothetical protein